MYFNQRNTRKYCSHTLNIVHRRGIIEIFPRKHVFYVERVSSLIDIDQRYTVEGSVSNNIRSTTQLSALFRRCIQDDKSV